MNANTVSSENIVVLSQNVRERAVRLMGPQKASELAEALASCHGPVPKKADKLLLDAAHKLFATGKLRQAEKAYLELVEKRGDLPAFVGLARTQAALEDEVAALNTLRDGAARLARSGDRATAVSLLAEAVQLVPTDLSAHRRLAAALANQGDMPGAVDEYARFVDVALTTGDSRRALLELAYGRETLGDLPGLLSLVDRVTSSHLRADAPRPAARQAPLAHHSPAPTPLPVPPSSRPRADWSREAPAMPPVATKAEPPKVDPSVELRLRALPAASATPGAAPRTQPDASHTAVVLKNARTVTYAEHNDLEAPINVLERAGVLKPKVVVAARPALDVDQQLKSLPPLGSGLDGAATAASRAALLTGARDPRATEAAIDAARRLLALGKLQSASDVLLDYIGRGFTDREAQRLLIEVDCALGRREIAKEKCGLLSQAYRLDGRGDVADDVERLAKIL